MFNNRSFCFIDEVLNSIDEPKITLTQKEALRNAPKKDSDYFKVPKVIDNN